MLNQPLLQQAVKYLSMREYSQQQLKQKLLAKGFELEDIEAVIAKLAEQNYQSDSRFAEMLFRSRINKGYGWNYIRQELQQKGINAEEINQLQQNHQIDWYKQAELAYNKRFGGSEIANDKDKLKRMRFLYHRGFDHEQIQHALFVSP